MALQCQPGHGHTAQLADDIRCNARAGGHSGGVQQDVAGLGHVGVIEAFVRRGGIGMAVLYGVTYRARAQAVLFAEIRGKAFAFAAEEQRVFPAISVRRSSPVTRSGGATARAPSLP